MLSEFQQGALWESWLSAQIRSDYFAALTNRYQHWQKMLVCGSLVLSSGATIALLTTVIPNNLSWIKPALTVLAAALSAWSLVAKNERNAIDCADLHSRWNSLALDYEILWSNTHTKNALAKLESLRRREIEISKSSASMPEDLSLLSKLQDNVTMHHQHELVA